MEKKNTNNNVAYMFFNCDEWKGTASMNPVYNAVVYRKRAGRRALWNKIKEEYEAGRIRVGYFNKTMVGETNDVEAKLKEIREYVLEGDPMDANDLLTYGFILEAAEV